MKQPVKPNPEDCCDSGCNPCVFDVYEKRLKVYQRYLNQQGETLDLKENLISELEHTVFILVESVNLCDNHKLLKFRHAENLGSLWWENGQHFLVKYCGDNNCSRAYTPLKYSPTTIGSNEFSIIVKDCGLVSKHLCLLPLGSETLWRGPYGSYESKNKNRLIMIAQGTGIAPFYSIINGILADEENMSKITLYYCCRSTDTILLREKLYSFHSFWNFSYKIFISNPSDIIPIKYKEPICNYKLGIEEIKVLLPFYSQDEFLICGSKGFMECFKSMLLKLEIPEENIVKF